MRAFGYERPTQPRRRHRPARRARPRGAPARRRDRPDHPASRRTIRRGSSSTSSGSTSSTPRSASGDGQLTIGARTVMTDIAADQRIRRDSPALAEAAAVVGSVQIRNRATLAGNICNASPAADTAPALLVYGARVVATGPAGDATHPDRRVLRPVGRHDARPGRARHARSSCRGRPSGAGAVHVRRTRRRGHDLASVTLACAVGADGVDAAGLRQPRSATAPRRRRHRPARRSGGAGRREGRAARGAVRRRQPVRAIDAGEPGLSPRDAPCPRPAGGRDSDRAAAAGARS